MQNAHNELSQQEESNMSDLANSCEYLTSEKLCLAVSENEKAKASRQVRCKNEEKMTCCYLCMFVMNCATPCRFLGNTENGSQQIYVEKTQINSTPIKEEKTEETETKNDLAYWCSSCNIEMSQTRTTLRIEGWEGSNKPTAQDPEKLGSEDLPVIVYLCPQCGKIDLKADKN